MENKIVRTADISFVTRSKDDVADVQKRSVEGVACVFNQTTDLGWFTEEIDSRAFDNCDMSDVVLNFNHDNNLVLARTTNGSLNLSIEEDGLHQTATIVDTSTGRDVLTLLQEGLISKMSFAFFVGEDKWDVDGEKEHRTITKIDRLVDVSLVTFPAYNQTSASLARSEDSLVEEHRKYKEKYNEQRERMDSIYGR